jgi:hypothetical protein
VSASRSSKCSSSFFETNEKNSLQGDTRISQARGVQMFMFLVNKHVHVVAFIKGPTTTGPRPPVSGIPATRGRRPRIDAWTCPAVPIFLKFFYFKKMNFWKFGKWTRAFGRMGVQHPHVLKLAPTLGSANSSKIHGEWRFHFFLKKKIPKFRFHLDFHIYLWDFCFMKKLIH